MKRFLVCLLFAMSLSVGMVGCGEKTSQSTTVKKETEKGSDTVKTTVEETKTGDQKETPPNP